MEKEGTPSSADEVTSHLGAREIDASLQYRFGLRRVANRGQAQFQREGIQK